MTESALHHRIRPGGAWQIVLRGVYLSYRGELGGGIREVAAALYGGPDSVITGNAALIRYGLRTPDLGQVDLLVPAGLQRQSTGFVVIHRTRRMPDEPSIMSGLKVAPVGRAVADAARAGMDPESVRALVASAVQRRYCGVDELAREYLSGPRQGSSALGEAVTEVRAGVRSVAEADLRRLIIRSGLPQPLYNPRLFVGSAFLASPDVWWPDAGVACEVDSAEWHLSPRDWRRTQDRHGRMSSHGIIVLHYAPSRIRTDGKGVIADLTGAIDKGSRRPRLLISTYPAAGAVPPEGAGRPVSAGRPGGASRPGRS